MMGPVFGRAPLAAGMKKESLHMEAWLKDAAPNDGLRRWFGHGPEKWNEFQDLCSAELDGKPDAIGPTRRGGRQGQCHFAL